MSERIVRQLKNLKKLEPDQGWLKSTKDQLVQTVKLDTLTKHPGWTYNFQVFLLSFERKFMPIANKMIGLFLAISVIGGMGLAAEAEYIPTKPLYKVKQTLEKVELVLATSAKQEAKVYLKHAKKRSDEALKIAQTKDVNTINKEKNIITVMAKLRNDLSAAAATLEIVKQEPESASDAKDLAREVTEKAQSTVSTLNQVAEASETKNVTDRVSEAINSVEAVESNAIEILAGNQQPSSEENWDANYLTYDQLKELVAQKLKRGEERMIKNRFALARYKNNLNLKEVMEVGGVEASSSVAVLSDEQIRKFEESLNQAEKILAGARKLIDDQEFVKALNKLKEASSLVTEVEKALAQAEDPMKEEMENPQINKGETETNLQSDQSNSVQNPSR